MKENIAYSVPDDGIFNGIYYIGIQNQKELGPYLIQNNVVVDSTYTVNQGNGTWLQLNNSNNDLNTFLNDEAVKLCGRSARNPLFF